METTARKPLVTTTTNQVSHHSCKSMVRSMRWKYRTALSHEPGLTAKAREDQEEDRLPDQRQQVNSSPLLPGRRERNQPVAGEKRGHGGDNPVGGNGGTDLSQQARQPDRRPEHGQGAVRTAGLYPPSDSFHCG